MDSSSPIRWGILGTGRIARKFAAGLNLLPDAVLHAVGSRNDGVAKAFAAEFGARCAYGSYSALVEDADVDIVYVATPHVMHAENMLLALDAGKAVLCEKPFTINAEQAEKLIQSARAHGLFLMEAMWTRFVPAVVQLRRLLENREIGDVRFVSADFGFRSAFPPEHRIHNRALGGGALLDVGIYPVSFASMILGEPRDVQPLGHVGSTGVDEQVSVLLGYDGGRMAVLYSAINVDTPGEAVILGTEGRIKVHHRMISPSTLTITRGEEEQVIDAPLGPNGMEYQAAEAMACLRRGETESQTMPLGETLQIMRTLDQIRQGWGIVYPGEAA